MLDVLIMLSEPDALPDPSLKVARTVLIELPRHHLVDETAVLTNYRIHSASLDCNYTD